MSPQNFNNITVAGKSSKQENALKCRRGEEWRRTKGWRRPVQRFAKWSL